MAQARTVPSSMRTSREVEAVVASVAAVAKAVIKAWLVEPAGVNFTGTEELVCPDRRFMMLCYVGYVLNVNTVEYVRRGIILRTNIYNDLSLVSCFKM